MGVEGRVKVERIWGMGGTQGESAARSPKPCRKWHTVMCPHLDVWMRSGAGNVALGCMAASW